MNTKIIAPLALVTILISCGTIRQQYFQYGFIPQAEYAKKANFSSFHIGPKTGLAYRGNDLDIKVYPRFDKRFSPRQIMWAIAVKNKGQNKWDLSDESFKLFDSPDGNHWQAITIYSDRRYAVIIDHIVGHAQFAAEMTRISSAVSRVATSAVGALNSESAIGSQIVQSEQATAEQLDEQAIANSDNYASDAATWSRFVAAHFLYPQSLASDTAYSGVLFSESGAFALYRLEVTGPDGQLIAFQFVQDRDSGL